MGTKTLNISDEDRELLTDEELAGMEEGEDFDETSSEEHDGSDAGADDGKADDAGDGADDDNDKGADDGADAGNDAGDDDGNATDDAAAGRDDGADPDPAPAAEPAPRRAPIIQAELPADYDDQVKAVADRKKELRTKFSEGDIDQTDYDAQLDEISRDERALERMKDRVDLADQMRREQWISDVQTFLDANPAYKSSTVLHGALDQAVRRLQVDASNPMDPDILAKAHKTIASEFPEKFGKAKPADVPARKPPRTAPSLARVPAAEVDQPGDGEFDWLDSLQTKDPMKFEAELEKLQRTQPAKYEEYMAS